jgi:hypothetical protein
VRRGGAAFLAASVSILTTPAALANGRYPTAGLVVFDPIDRDRLAVRTTFGVLVSRDRGATFDYVCESALRLGIEEDPMLAFTASGRLVVATFGGVLASDDACSYAPTPELEGVIVPDLARSASEPDTLVAFRLLGKGGGLYESGVVRSDDGGATFEAFPLLPEAFLPVTIDVAAGEPSRVYLTARRGSDDGFDSVLLVSDDGGATFDERSIPETSEQRLAYIAGVHPIDAGRLAVRVNEVERTLLYETRDSGATFELLFVADGLLTGFAYSPDGSELAFGGTEEGLFGGSSATREFERRADVAPMCLGWNDDGLWACADARTAGFSFGRSTDGGRTFEPLLRFADLCGSSSCRGESDVGALCSNDWRTVGPSLSATCNVDVPDGGPSTDAGDSPAGGARRAFTGRGGCAAGGFRGTASGAVAAAVWCALVAARRRKASAARRLLHSSVATGRAPRPTS